MRVTGPAPASATDVTSSPHVPLATGDPETSKRVSKLAEKASKLSASFVLSQRTDSVVSLFESVPLTSDSSYDLRKLLKTRSLFYDEDNEAGIKKITKKMLGKDAETIRNLHGKTKEGKHNKATTKEQKIFRKQLNKRRKNYAMEMVTSYADVFNSSSQTIHALYLLEAFLHEWKSKISRKDDENSLGTLEFYEQMFHFGGNLETKDAVKFTFRLYEILDKDSFSVMPIGLARLLDYYHTIEEIEESSKERLIKDVERIGHHQVLATALQNSQGHKINMENIIESLKVLAPSSSAAEIDYGAEVREISEKLRAAKFKEDNKSFISKYPNPIMKNNFDYGKTDSIRPSIENNVDYHQRLRSDLMCDQLSRESIGYCEVKSIRPLYSEETEQNVTKVVDYYRERWSEKIKENIVKRISYHLELLSSVNEEVSNFKTYKMNLAPFLMSCPLDDIVDFMMINVERMLSNGVHYSPTSIALEFEFGKAMMQRFEANRLIDESGLNEDGGHGYMKVYEKYLDWLEHPTSDSEVWNHREAFSRVMQIHGTFMSERRYQWDERYLRSIGQELLDVVFESTEVNTTKRGKIVIVDPEDGNIKALTFNRKVKAGGETTGDAQITLVTLKNQSQELSVHPLLYKLFRNRGGRTKLELIPYPQLAELYEYQRFINMTFSSVEMPMIAPPLPCTSIFSHANYFITRNTLFRQSTNSKDPGYHQDPEQMKLVVDAINVLGSTPWKLNKPILDLIIKVFNEPNKYREHLVDLQVPLHPSDMTKPTKPAIDKKKKAEMSEEEIEQLKAHAREMANFDKVQGEMFSLWCSCLYTLSIANHHRDDIVYFPHSMDFRGRVYPIPPFLNHMTNDVARSLLVFGKGKPLGKRGLEWLKIHIVNLSEIKKKASIPERLAYADEILDDILDSAENPFTGKKWWLISEVPWQCLSACMELRNALASPDPEKYVSHLPIHQDGSCNGLQHYSALGRDHLGAKAVNVAPAEVPQDVYSEIAAIVDRLRSEDEVNSPDERTRFIASICKGHIKRKVVKQTVMTTVYGVTPYGAKLQIAKQIRDLDGFPQEHREAASKYLSSCVFRSLNELFTSSQQIQDWFNQCSNVISGHCVQNVSWKTPLGLHVVQPYEKVQQIKFSPVDSDASGAKLMTRLTSIRFPAQNTSKQKNGFPPNFIHSLDSSHMMLTALQMWSEGLTYGSVHDCYWTHADDVDAMNTICRKQFFELHSQPILTDLSAHMKKTYLDDLPDFPYIQKKACKTFEAIPEKGQLDLESVKESQFFFS